jgi:hypothetical protein
MAFKMKGFNPGKGTGMGSAFTKRPDKTTQTRREISRAMYKEDDAPHEPTKYSKEEKQAGAGSSLEFYRKEGGDTKTKKVIKKGKTQKDTKWSGKTGDVVTGGGMKNTLYVDEEVKKDRKGKTKKTKYKDTAKKSITGKKRTIELDSYGTRNIKQERASKEAEKEGKDPSVAANPYEDVGEAQFTGHGSGKKTHKSGARKATLTTRGKHAGRVEEKERRKSGIGYRKTGRSYVDDAYVESQKQAKADAVAAKQKKKDDKAKAKADKPTFKEKRADVKEQHRQKDLAEQEATRRKIQERKERKGKA